MKKIIVLACIMISTVSYTQELEWDANRSFDVTFDIDSATTSDGVSWDMAISGQAGPYGMAYGSVTLTNFTSEQTQGEYFGYFFTQVENQLFRGTTNGLWKKVGSKFKTFAYDNDKVGGIINLVTGSWDLVGRKVNFSVAPVKD